MFVQLVEPRTGTVGRPGMCLQFTQTVFRAPVAHPSATAAANATKFRHATREMPNVSVPVWFDHWGTYGAPATYANWGHVVTWIPGRGFLSSPGGGGEGQQWFSSIEEIQRVFAGSFLFWSEDINGLRVCEPAPVVPVYESEDEDMAEYYFEATGDSSPVNGKPRIKAGVQKIGGVTYANVWERVGGSARRLFDEEWQGIVAYRAENNLRPIVPRKISGNAIEQIVYVGQRAESKE